MNEDDGEDVTPRTFIHTPSGPTMQKPSGLKPPGRGGKHSSPVGRTSTGSAAVSAAAVATGSKEGAWGRRWWVRGRAWGVLLLEEPLGGGLTVHGSSPFCPAAILLIVN